MSTFLEDLEELEPQIVDWAYNTINQIVDILTDGGKPYGLEEQTMDERIAEYMVLRDNPDACARWLQQQLDFLIKKLSDSGLDPKQINSVHPYDVVFRLGMHYSATMEGVLNARA